MDHSLFVCFACLFYRISTPCFIVCCLSDCCIDLLMYWSAVVCLLALRFKCLVG